MKLSKKESKLSKFNTRNIKKRLKREPKNKTNTLQKKNQIKILQNKKSIWKLTCWKYREIL